MTVKTAEEIFTEIQEDILDINPNICDFHNHSMQRIIHEPIAIQLYKLHSLLDLRTRALIPATAEGDDLSALVLDRLPDGRLPGYPAEGEVEFRRMIPYGSDITIPIGTIVSAPSETTDGPVYFSTTEEVILLAGSLYASAEVTCTEAGENGNVRAHAISGLITSLPIDIVDNALPCSGGTEMETDEELLERYITSIKETGKATSPLIIDHLNALHPDVREVQLFTLGEGDLEIVIDCDADPATSIYDCIEENVAAGICCVGIIAAYFESGANEVSLDDTVGGDIYIRARDNIAAQDSVPLTYKDTQGTSEPITVTIPQGTRRGDTVKATLVTANKATEITATTYAGSYRYDGLIGLGREWPYLFVRPQNQACDVTASIKFTATPEDDLTENIEASLTAFLDSYQIGADIEFSDIIDAILVDHETERHFVGIDRISSLSVLCKSTTITQLSQTITIENDERVIAGTITLNIT